MRPLKPLPALLLAAFTLRVMAAEPVDAYPQVAQAYLVRLDGRELWGAQPDRRLPPASLTKIMSALLLLDDYQPDAIVPISATAAAMPAAKLGLRAGERMRAADLLAAMLIHSANDACIALAEWSAGSELEFVERMNARALALGLANTHFSNACGFDAPSHYSSARDLLRLADLALKKPVFAQLTRTSALTVRALDGRGFTVKTSNPLVTTYPGIVGGKTGYTARAGTCLAVYAERDGHTASLLLLNARDRWWDASGLLDLAFEYAAANAH